MKTDNANSESTSAATSAGAKPTTTSSHHPLPDAEAKSVGKKGIGESAYLSRQQQLASQAISQTLSGITKELTRAVDPRVLMQRFPWMTLGASAVAGFAAAATLIPSKEQQALRKLATIERALHPQPKKAEENGHSESEGSGSKGEARFKSGRSGLMHAVLGEVIGAIKPAVISLLSAGVTAAAARPSEDEMKAAAAAEDAETGKAAGNT